MAHLCGRRLLLVVDTFEHLAAAAPLIADLCMACPDLTVLVTSRMALHVRGEREYPVFPLSLPDLAHLPVVEGIGQSAAVHLFMRQARDVWPDVALTEANAAVVAALCVQLDGLPLAIELAAASVKMLPLPDLLARLEEQPLDVLVGGACDLPARQRTMDATLTWSYELLDPATRAVFRWLAVFADGFTLEAASTVCTGMNAATNPAARIGDIFGRLTMLVDANLLAVTNREGEPRLTEPRLTEPRLTEPRLTEPRLTMLSLMHAFALERLWASGQGDEARRQHARYFLTHGDVAAGARRGQPAGRAGLGCGGGRRLAAGRDSRAHRPCWRCARLDDTARMWRLAGWDQLYLTLFRDGALNKWLLTEQQRSTIFCRCWRGKRLAGKEGSASTGCVNDAYATTIVDGYEDVFGLLIHRQCSGSHPDRAQGTTSARVEHGDATP